MRLLFCVLLLCAVQLTKASPHFQKNLNGANAILQNAQKGNANAIKGWLSSEGQMSEHGPFSKADAEAAIKRNTNKYQDEVVLEALPVYDNKSMDNLNCLGNDCVPPPEPQPDHSQNAFVKLSALFGASHNAAISGGGQTLFHGKPMACHITFGKYNNCCALHGWGQSIKLAGCSDDEKALHDRRMQGHCHYVGHYKKSKFERRDAFCCYPNRLARLIQEHVHHQIGWQWGHPKHNSECRGIHIKQLQQVNFDSLNLSEVAGELQSRVKPVNAAQIKTQFENQLKQKVGTR